MLSRNSYIGNNVLAGSAGLLLAALAFLAMAWVAYGQEGGGVLEGSAGLCFPSPNQWALEPMASLGLSVACTGVCVLLLLTLNGRFNVIPGTGVMYATLYLLAQGAVPWVNTALSSANLLLLGTLICTHLLFAQYGRRNAAPGFFVIFSTLAWGAMVQYSFVLVMPLFLVGGVFLNVFRLRELCASVMGILAPFAIVFGLGLADPLQMSWPELTNLFKGFTTPTELLLLMITLGFSALMILLLTASNTIGGRAVGQQHRAGLAFINLLGIATVWYMVFDATNMMAYTSVLAACLGLQTARYAVIQRHRLPYLPMVVMLPVYITLYILTILN